MTPLFNSKEGWSAVSEFFGKSTPIFYLFDRDSYDDSPNPTRQDVIDRIHKYLESHPE